MQITRTLPSPTADAEDPGSVSEGREELERQPRFIDLRGEPRKPDLGSSVRPSPRPENLNCCRSFSEAVRREHQQQGPDPAPRKVIPGPRAEPVER